LLGRDPLTFATVLYPFNGNKAPQITFEEEAGNAPQKGLIHFSIVVDGKRQTIKQQF